METDAGGRRGVYSADDRPEPDVAPIHDRQMVILERSNWTAWLEQTGNETELLRALPVGSLEVEQVRA
jgi:putative SOS response-associated peptidase YedK